MLLILLLEFILCPLRIRENCVMCAGRREERTKAFLVCLLFVDLLVLFNLSSSCANLVISKAFE